MKRKKRTEPTKAARIVRKAIRIHRVASVALRVKNEAQGAWALYSWIKS